MEAMPSGGLVDWRYARDTYVVGQAQNGGWMDVMCCACLESGI